MNAFVHIVQGYITIPLKIIHGICVQLVWTYGFCLVVLWNKRRLQWTLVSELRF